MEAVCSKVGHEKNKIMFICKVSILSLLIRMNGVRLRIDSVVLIASYRSIQIIQRIGWVYRITVQP